MSQYTMRTFVCNKTSEIKTMIRQRTSIKFLFNIFKTPSVDSFVRYIQSKVTQLITFTKPTV